MNDVTTLMDTTMAENTDNKTILISRRRAEFEAKIHLMRSRASLKKQNELDASVVGRTELSNLLLNKYLFVNSVENVLSISILFTSYFAFIYESDHTSNEDVFYFMSALVTSLTLVFVVLRFFLFKLHKLHLLAKNRFFESNNFEREILLGGMALLAYLIHPNMLFFRKKWILEHCYTSTSPYFYYFKRNFNEYLFLFQFHVHLIKLIKNYLTRSVYANDSTERISDMFGFKRGYIYVTKCMIKENNIMYFVYLLAIMIFYLGVMLRVVEFAVYPSGSAIGDLFAASWNSTIVIFTIGYGDLFPFTYFGRLFVIEVCFFAAIVLSFVTSQFLTLLKLNAAEQASQNLQNNVILRQRMSDAASVLLVYTYRSIRKVAKQKGIIQSYLKYKLDGAKKHFKKCLHEYKNDEGVQELDVEKELMKIDTIIDNIVEFVR